jgi:ATP-binding cassette, subfamily B, bacterial
VSTKTGDDWIRRLAGYCWQYKRSVLIGTAGAMTAVALSLVVPLFERATVNGLTSGGSVVPWLVALALAAPINYGASFLRVYHGGRFSLGAQYSMRTEMHRKLLRTDGGKHDEVVLGQAFSRATSDLTLVQQQLALMPRTAGCVILLVGTMVACVLLSPLLSVVVLVVIAVFLVAGGAARRRIYPATWEAQQAAGELAGVVDEYVAGVRVIKGLGQDDRSSGRFDVAARRLFATRMRTVRMNSQVTPALSALPAVGQIAVLAVGGWLAVHGEISLGTLLAFFTYLAQVSSPVSVLAQLAVNGPQARAAMHRIFDLLDLQPDVVQSPTASELPAVGDAESAGVEIEFADVDFSYTPARQVLDGFSLSVAAGETVALVGKVGSGKSTAALLLLRLFEVQGGGVRVRGRDVRELTFDSLRSAIGFVPEESMLFSDTVRANIAFGRPDATEDEVLTAAKAAGVHGFASALPEGYDTLVGEGGLTLSGGQRQRIAIARAIIKTPDILVLDDATSAVDAATEDEIHEALAAASGGRTTLLIAHRRSTLRLADRIAVIDEGRVVDVGVHEDLLARCALYRLLISGPGGDAEGIEAGEVMMLAGQEETSPWERAPVAAPPGKKPARAAALADMARRVAELPQALDGPEHSDEDPEAAGLTSPLRMRGMLAPFRWRMTLLVGIIVVDALAALAFPLLVRNGLDHGVASDRVSTLMVFAAVALAAAVLGWLTDIGTARVAGRLSERLLFRLRCSTFAHVQRLGLDFHEREGTGRILTRMTMDLDAVASYAQTGVAPSIVSALTVVGVFTAAAVISPVLSIPLFVAVPVLAVATRLYRRAAARVYSDARNKAAEVNADLHESVRGARVTQAFHRVQQRSDRFAKLSEAYRHSQSTAQWLGALYFPFIVLVFDGCAVAVLWLSQGRVQHAGLTVGGVIAFLIYLDLLYAPTQQLAIAIGTYQKSRVGLRKLSELITAAGPVRPAGVPATEHFGEVAVDGVSFSYPGQDRLALADIDLAIADGETIALVGASGAGKSSLVKLIARYYEPSTGTIRVNGRDASEYDLDSFRSRLIAVAQEPFLFAGTVRDTIAFCRPEITDEEVQQAAEAVGAHAMISSLAGGYRHPVASGGGNLSAGQRQLVALARAYVAAPDVLLLDEATASLDLVSEAAVAAGLATVTRRQTTVIVAHRLATAARADRIVVVEAGRIVQVGRHEELVGAEGPYRLMYAASTGPESSSAQGAEDPWLSSAERSGSIATA